MYDLPGRSDIGKCVIDGDTVLEQGQPHARAPRAPRRVSRPTPGRVLGPSAAEPRRGSMDYLTPRTSTWPSTATTSVTGRIDRARPRPASSALMDAAGRAPAGRARHPHHRHQRQGLDGADRHPAARGAGPHRRHLHQPAPGAGQRADHPQRRADRRRGPGRADRAPSPTSRSWPAWSPSYFEIVHRGGLPVVRRRRRRRDGGRGRACSGGGTPPTSSTARSPWSPTSASTTPSTPARRWPTSPRRRRASSSPAARSCSGRPTPSWRAIFRGRRRRRGS